MDSREPSSAASAHTGAKPMDSGAASAAVLSSGGGSLRTRFLPARQHRGLELLDWGFTAVPENRLVPTAKMKTPDPEPVCALMQVNSLSKRPQKPPPAAATSNPVCPVGLPKESDLSRSREIWSKGNVPAPGENSSSEVKPGGPTRNPDTPREQRPQPAEAGLNV
ncbi:hypothetical protein CB1_000709018 [Camelus ferus]|nr:hypothetical protein CB1_000709018 [Camelus ferus]